MYHACLYYPRRSDHVSQSTNQPAAGWHSPDYDRVVVIIGKGDIQILAQLAINQGDWLMLLACLFYSGYTIGLRNRPQISNFTMMFFLAIAAWLLSLPMLLAESLTSGLLWPDDMQSWLVILFVALVPSFLSQIFYMRGWI